MSASSGKSDPNLTRAEEQAADASQVNTRSSYTPRPIKKKRSVTHVNLKAVHEETSKVVPDTPLADSPQSHSGDQGSNQSQRQAQPVHVAPVQSQDTPQRPASIQLNMNTMDVIASELVETEQKRTSKLAEFEPLSMTMMGEVTPAPNVQQNAWVDDWTHSESTATVNVHHPQEELETGLHAFEQPINPSPEPMGDLYRSRRHIIFWMFCVMITFAWFIGMSMQVGVERLINDPYGETAQAIFGVPKSLPVEVETPVLPVTSVIVAPTLPQLHVEKLELLGRSRGHRVFAIHVNIKNPGETELTAARIKLSLRSPDDAPQDWVKRFEFNCCQDAAIADLSARERRALLKEVVTGDRAQDGQVRLEPGASRSFIYLAPLKSSLKLGSGEPEVELELLFSE